MFARSVLEENFSRYIHSIIGEKLFPVAFIMFDLDHFKRINDTFGHTSGDHVLKEVGNLIATHIHTIPQGLAIRYGGEEFFAIVPATSEEKIKEFLEEIRKSVEKKKFLFNGQQISVTISIGCAIIKHIEENISSYKDFYKKADSLLYEAKKKGRNRVEIKIYDS